MKTLFKLFSVLVAAGFLFASCEGPMGPAGKDGANGADGADGVDANETCKECHTPTVVDQKVVEFDFSKHKYGEAAFEEGGNTTCAPCHEQEGFHHVAEQSVPSTFTLNATTGKYANDYKTTTSLAIGELSCYTCHNAIHTTYVGADFYPLTTTAAVSMTMWAGAKTINIAQDGGMSNLCIKCHQPRPLARSSTIANGNVVNYDSLANFPTLVFYDNAVGNAAPNKVIPSYRTHVHYGTVGAVYAGVGGIEFPGTLEYGNSAHTAGASCKDCHMATIFGRAGGHTFRMRNGEGALTSSTTWNFNSCNVGTGCHTSAIDSKSTIWVSTRKDIKDLLDALAVKINAVGGATPILHSESDGEANLWAGITAGNWDGYLNIYDPSTNPDGVWKNPGNTSSWTTEAKAINNALTIFPSLTNGVMGAMINFQMCLRDYSLGIHNTKYTKALLQNSLETI